MFLKRVKIYLRMLNNYSSMCSNKSIYFYLYSMPLFGFIPFLIIKSILFTKSNYLINNILSHKIFLSALRYLHINDKLYIGSHLKKYNSLFLKDKQKKVILYDKQKLDQLNLNGFCKLGKVFTNRECSTFIKSLVNKEVYNSQVILQSSGKTEKFNPIHYNQPLNSNAYFCFTPKVLNDFIPIQRFLKQKSLQNLVNSYLNFNASIYACHTWFNPQTKENHYVHRPHRDNDDFRFLGLIIYWNKIIKSNGATIYVRGSHRNLNKDNTKIYLEGNAGEAFLVDLSGLHSGTQVISNYRYTTFIRFGYKFNYASVMDGFLHSIDI